MRLSVALIAGSVLTLCGMPLPAQTSASFSRADKYQATKAVMQQFYNEGILQSAAGRNSDPGEYDLSQLTCTPPGDYVGLFEAHSRMKASRTEEHRNDDIASFVLGAAEMVVWENDFQKLHIPETIWRPVLARYENRVLASRRDDRDAEAIAAELNARMARAGRSRPRFIYNPGCGDGEVQVQFTMKPGDAQLFLLPVFLYKVCEVQHLSPMDFKACDRWREIADESVSPVSGDYKYVARWSDGVTRCGTLTFNDFQKSGENNHGRFVITKVRTPGCSPAF